MSHSIISNDTVRRNITIFRYSSKVCFIVFFRSYMLYVRRKSLIFYPLPL